MEKGLLHLIDEFPQAFADPESPMENSESKSAASLSDANLMAVNQTRLLDLIDEFPQAFADPERPLNLEVENTTAGVAAAAMPAEREPSAAPLPPTHALPHLPAGYAYALRRRVPTFTWGQVDFNLIYEEKGLAVIWITVGKSGTEVQSLCEAIARLINLLLAKQVPIAEISREIRGIRGADSEGLGPNRILGLADLTGKVLQEAPAQWQAIANREPMLPDEPPAPSGPDPEQPIAPDLTLTPALASSSNSLEKIETSWQSVESPSGSSTLCPECGAELSQVNGCKGGACIVCGYSSCS